MQKKERPPLAERLRATARAARLTSEELGGRLGVDPSTVRAWWRGRNEPSASMLAAYAKAVGSSVEYLITGEEPLLRMFLEATDALMAGKTGSEAIDTVLPGQRTDQERGQIDLQGSAFRQALVSIAGPDWDLLTEAQKLEILRQIQGMARSKRRKRAEGDQE